MKIHLIISVFSLFSFQVFGQDTKFVSKKTKIDLVEYFEEYHVLKEHPDVKEGSYVKYRSGWTGVVVLESGNYKNGNKVGLWETFFNPNDARHRNSIKERGHYVNGKRNGLWTFFHLDTLVSQTSTNTFGKKHKPDSINIYIEQGTTTIRQAGMYLNDKRVGDWMSFDLKGNLIQKYNFSTGSFYDRSLPDSSTYNINRQAVFLGGRQHLDFHLYLEAPRFHIYDNLHRTNRDSVVAVANFTVDKTGNVKNIHLTRSSSFKKFDAELLDIIPSTNNLWIPAIKDGQKVENDVKLAMRVIVNKIDVYHYEYRLQFEINEE